MCVHRKETSVALVSDMAFKVAILPRYAMVTPGEGVSDLCIGRPLVRFRAASKSKKYVNICFPFTFFSFLICLKIVLCECLF